MKMGVPVLSHRLVRFALPLITLVVACLVFTPPVDTQKKPPAKPINLNTATLQQLEQLPGVGPITAKDILDFRKKSGPFRSVNDLLAVRRITKARLEKLRPYVYVAPQPAPYAKTPPH
jgi:competence ComEA-like helix-hairpin-helix protein